MKATEKAQDLTIHFYNVNVNNISSYGMEWEMAKQCALICVDEIIKTIEPHLNTKWWQEVRQEILKL